MSHSFPHPLIETLQTARRVVALTGAGISAESGIPTFREAQTGLWAKYDPMALATPQAFRQNPRLVWEWYAWRRQLVSRASPNPGHYALVQMADHLTHFTLITQNVDNLHQAAGSRYVLELHGNIARTKCFDENVIIPSWPVTDEIPPRCPRCGGRLRPDVVWFGESLSPEQLDGAFAAASTADLFFTIGTSGLVQPAASLPLLARQVGAVLVEINPHATPLTEQRDYHLSGLAGEILPHLVAAAWPVKA
jgi:NAD-dependent deacetylase